MNPLPQFFPASTIARATKSYRRAVHRRAAVEGWASRHRGNRLEYSPPASIQRRIRAKTRPSPFAAGSSPALARALFRDLCLVFMRALEELGISRDEAARKTVEAFSFPFKVSSTSLRTWGRNHAERGFVGLMENKAGRVGRKRKARR